MVNSTGIIAGPKRDLVGYEGNPPKVAWPGGAKIAISLVVNYEEGSELAIGDGDATREPRGRNGAPRSGRRARGRSNTARAPATGGCSTSSTSRT